jgi:CHAT domain-containing protein
MRKLISFLIVLFVTAAAADAASSSDRDAAAGVALAFYRAYAGGDLAAALSFWSPKSPGADAMGRRTRRFLRTHCLELGRLEATAIDVAGDAATVDVEAEWLDTSNMPNAIGNVDFGDGKLALRREDGRWRIADWTPAAVTFADVLSNGDDAARAAVLANPRIRCRAAVRELARRAVTFVNQTKYETASSLAAAAERIADGIGDDAALSLALSSESVLRRYFHVDRDLSLALAERSLALAERSDDADARVRAVLAWGRIRLGDYHERALALRDYVSDPALIALAAGRAAQVNNDNGDHWSSLQFSNLALQYAQETGDAASIINAELNIASTYQIYRDHPLSLAHSLKVVELARRAGFPSVWADALLDAALQEQCLGHPTRAKKLIDEAAREPSVKIRVPLVRAFCETNRAAVDRHLAEAGRLADAAGDSFLKAYVTISLARAYVDRGRPAAALPLLQQLHWQSSDTPEQRIFEAAALTAETERRLGHTVAALRAIDTAIKVSEHERSRLLGDDRQQRAFSAARLRVYGELVTIRVDARQALPALAAADEAKGRTLLDILGSRRATFDDVMTADERRREHDLRDRAATLRRKVGSAPHAARGALTEQLEQSRTDIDAFEVAMAEKYPRAIPTWAPPAPITEAALRQLLPDPSTAIVEFMVTDDRLHSFVVRRDAAGAVRVRARTAAIRGANLRRRIGRFVAALSRADVDYRGEARKLYDLLLAPLAPQLAHVRVVCIVPDGPLWQLPFESLVARDGRFFVEQAVPFYVPSIAVYARMRGAERKREDGTLFALADPVAGRVPGAVVSRLRAGETSPLPDAAREVREAARILGGHSAVYVGASASVRRLEEEATGYRVLHFATHGVLDDTNPMYSHLVLAPSGGDDGVLDAWQMMRMRFHAELAVLSACDTARGGDNEGEGVVGMSWALFVAGCPSTIATQWKIASAPTADLLIDFYRQWTALGNRPFAKATALANAQRAMLRQRGRRHPFFWAPFILVGVG